MDHSRDLDLLLLGKTGNGKSKTGNTLLGWKAFTSSASPNSVTKKIASEVAECDGRRITVVDGPGVGDTSGNDQEANSFVMEQLNEAIAINAKGYHAFLLVVRFGTRFERNDKNAVDVLKAIFGPDFIQKHCILLFTCGDNFVEEFEGQSKTIQGWCQEQSGPLKELYEECGGRVVLFDNMTKDAEKMKAQRDEVITMVDNLNFHGERYTSKHFAEAQSTRERLMVEGKSDLIDQEIMAETSLILQNLNQIHQLENTEERRGQLQQLHTKCDTMYKKIKSEDQGTGVLNKLVKTVTDIRQTVKSDIDECSRAITEQENWKRQQQEFEEKRKKMEQEQKLREEQKIQDEEQKIRDRKEMQKKEQKLREQHEEQCRREAEWRHKMKEEKERLLKEYIKVREGNEAMFRDLLKAFGVPLATVLLYAAAAVIPKCVIS